MCSGGGGGTPLRLTLALLALAASAAIIAADFTTLAQAQSAEASEFRIAAQRHSDGRTEFALQLRTSGAKWSERLLPQRRFLSAGARAERWYLSAPLELEGGRRLRIAVRPRASGRMEFAAQQRASADDQWSERLLPRHRFMPADPSVGRWLYSSAAALPGPTEQPTAATAEQPPAPEPAAEPFPCPARGYCGVFTVDGRLTAAAWLDDEQLYLADWDGRIQLLNIMSGEITTVLEGLSIPQGLTVLDGRLYIADMGNVCELHNEQVGAEFPACKRWPGSTLDAVLDFFRRAGAQITSYRIDAHGGLSGKRIVIDGIISYDRDHSPNGLTNDGQYVYASIGHPEQAQPESAKPGYYDGYLAERLPDEYGSRTAMMGTIVRFRPPRNEVEIWATGLRNVYGISIAPDGTIYGADNDSVDGLSTEGQLEELNAIRRGGFYGYPIWGSNEAPASAGVTEPVAILQGTASTFAHANADGVYVAYTAIQHPLGDGIVIDRFDYETWRAERIFNASSYITAILERAGQLYVVTFAGKVHIIDPPAAPVEVRATARQPQEGYVDQLIARGGPTAPAPNPRGFDLYLDADAGRLVYVKQPCSRADTQETFFLHIAPVRRESLPSGGDFANLDFPFSKHGWRSGDACRALVELPDFEIRSFRTGQSIAERTTAGWSWTDIWSSGYEFPR